MRTILKRLRTSGRRLLLLLFVSLLVVAPLSDVVFADGPVQGWMAPGDPTIKFAEVPAATVPAGNLDCDFTDYEMLVREEKSLPRPPFSQEELWHTAKCAVRTPRGVHDGEYLEGGGSRIAGKFQGNAGKVLTIPNSTKLITVTTFIAYQSLEVDWYDHIVPEHNFETGEVTYNMTGRKDLTNGVGRDIYFRPNSYATSSNGKWLVADTNLGFMRINLETREMLSFSPGVPYGIGSSANTSVAISDDGRYAIRGVARGSSKTLWIYDLNTCDQPSEPITGPANCQYKDLKPVLDQASLDFSSYTVRFASPDLLTLRATQRDDEGKLHHFLVRMAPGGKTIEDVSYLALGDSFSSGEGAYDYELGTDTPENQCHLSRKSYPYLAAATLGLDSFHSVACSGARYDPDYVATPQYESVNAPQWLAGSKTQRAFVAQAKPDVVTISMIGNDIGFKNKVVRCLAPDSCFHFREDRQSIVDEMNSKFNALVALYSNIKMNADENAKVYVLGYPQLFSATGDCRFSVNFDAEERRMAQGLVGYLNAVIKAATERAGVQYIDVEDAFSGNLLCGGNKEAANGLTAGNDIGVFGVNFVGNESFHPNQLGHQLLVDELLEQSGYFTKPMPEPDTTKTVPDVLSQAYTNLVGGAPGGGTAKRILFVGTDGIRGVVRGGSIEVNTNPMLPVNALFEVWFNSIPTYAGALTTDENGALQGEITVPEDLEPGFHTLHLYGQDLTGQDVDLYETVYVAASPEDYDGDGIHNQEEQCLVTEPIGIDYDRDGIDDACDLEISELADDVPPEVTGTPDREPDADDWYKDDVTITWSVIDPEPSSGAPTQPAPMAADKEGVHTYTSDESCDPLGNCATGSIEIKIDKTAPLLGQAVWSCTTACPADSTIITISVSDGLSGLAATEYFLGDNDPGLGAATPVPIENGAIKIKTRDLPVGEHQITIRAKDRAGNWSSPLHEYAEVYKLLSIKLVSRQHSAQPPAQTIAQKIVTVVKTVVETVLGKLSKLFKW